MLSVQVPAVLLKETSRALLVRLVDSGRTLWVPKSVGKIINVSAVQYHPPHALPSEFRKPEATALSVPAWWWSKQSP